MSDNEHLARSNASGAGVGKRRAHKHHRPHGLGSIRKIAKGKFVIVYDLPRTKDGRRRQKTETFYGSNDAAEARLASKLAEIRSGVAHDFDDRMTFNVLADRYLEVKATSREATTIAWYRRQLNTHIRPAIGNVMIRDLRARHIQTLLYDATNASRTKCKGEPLGATSRRNLLISIRAVLSWGVKQGFVVRNVAEQCDPPTAALSQRAAIRFEDIESIIDAAADTELAVVVPFALGTGLRRSEICALRWEDVELNRGLVRVERAAANVEGRVVIKVPKSRRSRRTEHLPPFVVELLRQHHTDQAKRHLALGAGNRGAGGLLFDRADTRRWDPNEMSRAFSRLVARKRLPKVRFHDLRHAHASMANAAGVPLNVISQSLGHSAIGVTDAIYVHLRDESFRSKADKLEAAFGATFRRKSKTM